MTTLHDAARQALEALLTYEQYIQPLTNVFGGPRVPEEGSASAKVDAAITTLRAALAEPQSGWDKWQAQKRGCSVCGVGANGETVGYVCIRNDCPTRVTCGGTP